MKPTGLLSSTTINSITVTHEHEYGGFMQCDREWVTIEYPDNSAETVQLGMNVLAQVLSARNEGELAMGQSKNTMWFTIEGDADKGAEELLAQVLGALSGKLITIKLTDAEHAVLLERIAKANASIAADDEPSSVDLLPFTVETYTKDVLLLDLGLLSSGDSGKDGSLLPIFVKRP